MKFSFLDRDPERQRLERLLGQPTGGLGVLYGRRRCGKSRLVREILQGRGAIYYVGDDREGILQRASLATEIARVLPHFDEVAYPDWESLLRRFWRDAKPGTTLALDELPALVAAAPELPSLLQKQIDLEGESGVHLLLAGSSQRMMQGLVLDRSAPLYGRASEILRIRPLRAGWIQEALGLDDPVKAVEAYAVWGGIPRYWELAGDFTETFAAVRELVLSPLGVLYEEPERLLLDDLRDTVQAASILSLIGRGCHRASEIAGRLGKPATSLSRPLQRLVEMDLIHRELPFGDSPKSSKRALYRISDPFLRFWFRFVEPEKSRLEARQIEAVEATIHARFLHHVGEVWEEIARASVAQLEIFGRRWRPAQRFWGAGNDRLPYEVDLVAESADGSALLIGEVEWSEPNDLGRARAELERKATLLPFADGRPVFKALWRKRAAAEQQPDLISASEILASLR